jgi:hypothetical protein
MYMKDSQCVANPIQWSIRWLIQSNDPDLTPPSPSLSYPHHQCFWDQHMLFHTASSRRQGWSIRCSTADTGNRFRAPLGHCLAVLVPISRDAHPTPYISSRSYTHRFKTSVWNLKSQWRNTGTPTTTQMWTTSPVSLQFSVALNKSCSCAAD